MKEENVDERSKIEENEYEKNLNYENITEEDVNKYILNEEQLKQSENDKNISGRFFIESEKEQYSNSLKPFVQDRLHLFNGKWKVSLFHYK